MNNDVRSFNGKVIGFRCFRCGEVKDRMWGTTCNACRSKADEAAKLQAEISKLTETIAKFNREKVK